METVLRRESLPKLELCKVKLDCCEIQVWDEKKELQHILEESLHAASPARNGIEADELTLEINYSLSDSSNITKEAGSCKIGALKRYIANLVDLKLKKRWSEQNG